ncbi:hypothetical protein VP01_794g1 [Puccinia sorghi]|uniref:Uncharacterized protein n=1 Tax=Puccinia sorghi TaxID=27349 RepID=A0A0L6UBK9_9BASI|nr:hypothetical protein VP01_794g1 [Puccinia sorghi]
MRPPDRHGLLRRALCTQDYYAHSYTKLRGWPVISHPYNPCSSSTMKFLMNCCTNGLMRFQPNKLTNNFKQFSQSPLIDMGLSNGSYRWHRIRSGDDGSIRCNCEHRGNVTRRRATAIHSEHQELRRGRCSQKYCREGYLPLETRKVLVAFHPLCLGVVCGDLKGGQGTSELVGAEKLEVNEATSLVAARHTAGGTGARAVVLAQEADVNETGLTLLKRGSSGSLGSGANLKQSQGDGENSDVSGERHKWGRNGGYLYPFRNPPSHSRVCKLVDAFMYLTVRERNLDSFAIALDAHLKCFKPGCKSISTASAQMSTKQGECQCDQCGRSRVSTLGRTLENLSRPKSRKSYLSLNLMDWEIHGFQPLFGFLIFPDFFPSICILHTIFHPFLFIFSFFIISYAPPIFIHFASYISFYFVPLWVREHSITPNLRLGWKIPPNLHLGWQ